MSQYLVWWTFFKKNNESIFESDIDVTMDLYESKYISLDNFKYSPLTSRTFKFHLNPLSHLKAKHMNRLIDRHGLPISL
jgi:hypothetical protein